MATKTCYIRRPYMIYDKVRLSNFRLYKSKVKKHHSLRNLLDASKAFDRVNYSLLFTKLHDKTVILFIVKCENYVLFAINS